MLLNQTRMENSHMQSQAVTTVTTVTLPTPTNLFKYVVKEKKKFITVVLDSDEEGEDQDQRSSSSTSTNAILPQPRKENKLKRKRSQGNKNDPISLSDSEDENEVDTTFATNTNNTESLLQLQQLRQSLPEPEFYPPQEELFHSLIQNDLDIFTLDIDCGEVEFGINETQEVPIVAPTDQIQLNEESPIIIQHLQQQQLQQEQQEQLQQEVDQRVIDEKQEKTDNVDLGTRDQSDSPSLSDMMDLDLSLEELLEEEIEEEIEQMEAPMTVDTIIPKTHLECATLLRTIELYIHSVTDSSDVRDSNQSDSSSETVTTRISRRTTRLQDNGSSVHNYYTTSKQGTPESSILPTIFTQQYDNYLPYVPNRAWYNSTWEDWAQLDAGDILHVPFTNQEIHIICQCVAKQISRKITKLSRELMLNFWQSIAAKLPGRTPEDCKWFWTDYRESTGNPTLYNKLIVIGRQKDMLRNNSHHQLLSKRKRSGAMGRTYMRHVSYANMTRETMVSEGSGDAITLAIYKDGIHGIRVAVGSLCDENTQYNMPGNLRLWKSDTKDCLSLIGHKSEMGGQIIWRTVTDVKMSKDESLIYSASHDGSANIWRAGTGKLVSTLQYHCKPINQLAVNYSTDENVLATCSNDGTATIWSVGRNGKTGSGNICELDTNFYTDPRVDCISFGHHASDNLLFLGINNNSFEHPGYIEVFDSTTLAHPIRFDSMMGCVSTLAISSSGKYVVSGNYNRFDNMSGDGYIHMHDFRLPKSVSKFYSGHPDVNIVAISPCERYVASGSADKEKSEVVLFDVRNSKRILHTLSHDQTLVDQSLIAPDSSIGIGGLHWMSDSRTIVTGGGDSTVKIWNVEGATRLERSYPTTNCVTSLTVHEDTMTIAAGVAGAQGLVHVWQP